MVLYYNALNKCGEDRFLRRRGGSLRQEELSAHLLGELLSTDEIGGTLSRYYSSCLRTFESDEIAWGNSRQVTRLGECLIKLTSC
jgi:hypothetical protein